MFIVMQHKPDRTQAFKGVANKGIGIDLMVFDNSKKLSISNVSSLPSSILDWNQIDDEFLVSMFDFIGGHVHDDGVLLYFPLNDFKLKGTLKGHMEAYHFSFFKKWMGVNWLQLTSIKVETKTINNTNPTYFWRI